MKDFFRELNFPRSVILLSLIASCVLGWFVYKGQERLAQLPDEAKRAPEVVSQIHTLGFSVEELSTLRSNSGLTGAGNDIDLYVRRKAKDPAVAIGGVEIKKTARQAGSGLEDVIYTLRPADPDSDFNRLALGNFLYKLEADLNQVVVTKIELRPADRLSPGEIGNDRWDYVVEVTTRKALDA